MLLISALTLFHPMAGMMAEKTADTTPDLMPEKMPVLTVEQTAVLRMVDLIRMQEYAPRVKNNTGNAANVGLSQECASRIISGETGIHAPGKASAQKVRLKTAPAENAAYNPEPAV